MEFEPVYSALRGLQDQKLVLRILVKVIHTGKSARLVLEGLTHHHGRLPMEAELQLVREELGLPYVVLLSLLLG